MSVISKFFIKCSGANKEILAEIPANYLETEITKFIGIGGAIFFTASLAFISSTFALSTFVKDIQIGAYIIDKLLICISFGLVWAFMIFNLDRYIVSSMRKEGTFTNQLVRAIPRILVALLFSVIISKPLEMEIFRTEIEAQLPQSANEQTAYIQVTIDSLSKELIRLRNENDTLRKNPFDSQFVKAANKEYKSASSIQDSLSRSLSPRIQKIDTEIYKFRKSSNVASNRIRQNNTRIANLNKEINDTVNIVTASDKYEKQQLIQELKSEIWKARKIVNKIKGELPPLLNEKKKIQAQLDTTQAFVTQTYNKLQDEKKEIGVIVKDKIKNNELEKEDIKKRIQAHETKRKLLNEKFNGLLARLKALDDLKSAEGNVVILIASTLVFLIFMTIETAPVFVKLMSKKTMYDQILEEYEKPIPSKEFFRRKIHDFFEEDARLIEKKQKILRNFYEKKLDLQEEFLNKSLGRIKNNEVEKFEKNLDEYSSYVSDNPDAYLKSFKSSSSPVIRKDGNLVWEDDSVLKRNLFNWFSWKHATFAGLGIVIIISTVLGVNYFNNENATSEKIEKKEPPKITQSKEVTKPKKEIQNPEIVYVEGARTSNEKQTGEEYNERKSSQVAVLPRKREARKNTLPPKKELVKRKEPFTRKSNNSSQTGEAEKPIVQDEKVTTVIPNNIIQQESTVKDTTKSDTKTVVNSSMDKDTSVFQALPKIKKINLKNLKVLQNDTLKQQKFNEGTISKKDSSTNSVISSTDKVAVQKDTTSEANSVEKPLKKKKN